MLNAVTAESENAQYKLPSQAESSPQRKKSLVSSH